MNEYLEREIIKLEDMVGFYASRLIGRPLIAPEHVYFSLTNRCCLRCVMCDIPKCACDESSELSTEEARGIISQIKEMGIRHLILSGGEPLLRKDLFELINFAKQAGIIWVDIITNGILIDDATAEKLVTSGLNHITVSLDGLKESNDWVRGSGSFDKSSQAIDRLNFFKKKLSLKGPSIGINFTILNKNIADIVKFVSFARDKKCNTVVFQPVLVSNVSMKERKKSSLWPKAREHDLLRANLRKLLEIREGSSDMFIYTDPEILKAIPGYFKGKRPGGKFKCYEGIKRVVITCEGKLWSCSGIYGDLRKESLKNLWNSSQMQKIRKNVKKCRAHCLQDCVYFPIDISGQIRKFYLRLSRPEEKEIFLARISSRIESCCRQLQDKAKSNLIESIMLS